MAGKYSPRANATQINFEALRSSISQLKELEERLDGRPRLSQIKGQGRFVKSLNKSAQDIPVVEKSLQSLIQSTIRALQEIYDKEKEFDERVSNAFHGRG